MKLLELKDGWLKMNRQQRKEFVRDNMVNVHWDSSGYAPRHPVFGTPSRETFREWIPAAIAQIDWLVSLID